LNLFEPERKPGKSTCSGSNRPELLPELSLGGAPRSSCRASPANATKPGRGSVACPRPLRDGDEGVVLSEKRQGVAAKEFWSRMGSLGDVALRSEVWREAELIAQAVCGCRSAVQLIAA
jgi:hypothetical protein